MKIEQQHLSTLYLWKFCLQILAFYFWCSKKCRSFMDILDGTIGVNQKYIFEPALLRIF